MARGANSSSIPISIIDFVGLKGLPCGRLRFEHRQIRTHDRYLALPPSSPYIHGVFAGLQHFASHVLDEFECDIIARRAGTTDLTPTCYYPRGT